MPIEAPVPRDSILMKSWEKYKASDEFRNSFKWASDVQHRTGSMWAAFVAGFEAAGGDPLARPSSSNNEEGGSK